MSKKQMTLVYYYIPQDQDDPQYPNVFGVMMSKSNIRLKDIYDNFPLKGTYIFRFKVMYDNTVAWLDLPDLQAKLPTFKEKIFVKATRVSWESQNQYGHYKISNNLSNGQNVKNTSTPIQSPVVKKQQSSNQKPKAKQIDILGDSGHGNGDLI